ncbi:hydrolase [Ornithobacterium rhinotracheale]|uniref:Hydrolase n=1 Tax=Ornithobacterium rhinotracheale TaxID=28251 RepID=A0A3R5WYX8_ORNRH|nr:hydrolase [Ornithobacterium rhinotracheale]QAR30335.1 hydrolase [Ornithobacterium rhinotracheale]
MTKSKLIAIDFDGTIVDDAYPAVGRAKFFAFETLKKLQADGHRLILWTYRHGKELEEAVNFCKENGVEFYAVNNSFEGENFNPEKASRKLNADIFIDDRNLGGFPGWGEVYKIINEKIQFNIEEHGAHKPKKKKGWFSF